MKNWKQSFVPDMLAGLTVSFAALSLGAAFGVMSGRGAFAGMIGAAVIPIVTSLLGGTRIQASGPTAPMTAVFALVIASAYERFSGDRSLAEQFVTLVLLLNGLFLVLAGLLRLGRFIQWVPQVVVLGFMNGIALLIWVDQVGRLLASGGRAPLEGGIALNSLIAFATLASIYALPWLFRKAGVPVSVRRFLPAIFITIVGFTFITTLEAVPVEHVSLGSGTGTIRDYGQMLLAFLPTDPRIFQMDILLSAAPFALQLALLAYLDSLLTSLVIDRMAGEQSLPNKELLAQGIANGASGLLQGIPGAQATIRSVLLIKEGARSRLAGVLVGVYALLGFLIFSKAIVLIASSVFIGVLLKAGLDVLDRDFPIAYFKNRWYLKRERNIQLLLIVYATLVTVLVDLNVAVLTGTVLFYLLRRAIGLNDAEAELADVHAQDLYGQEVDSIAGGSEVIASEQMVTVKQVADQREPMELP